MTGCQCQTWQHRYMFSRRRQRGQLGARPLEGPCLGVVGGRHGVGAVEVEQVRDAAQHRLLRARAPAAPEVVQTAACVSTVVYQVEGRVCSAGGAKVRQLDVPSAALAIAWYGVTWDLLLVC